MNRRDPEAENRAATFAFARYVVAIIVGFCWFFIIGLRLDQIEQTCKPAPVPVAEPERVK